MYKNALVYDIYLVILKMKLQVPFLSQQLIETNKLTSREQVTFTHIVFTAMSDEGEVFFTVSVL